MEIYLKDFNNFINKKRVALFGVNKDTINLLKYRRDKLISSSLIYSITHVIDFTLSYRKNINDILTNTLNTMQTTKVINNVDDFKLSLENREFDLILLFEDGVNYNTDNKIILHNIDDLQNIIETNYDDGVLKYGNKLEYNYKYGANEILTINSFVVNNYDVYLMSATDRQILFQVDKNNIAMALNRESEYIIRLSDYVDNNKGSPTFFKNDTLTVKDIKNLKLAFVIGSDFAIGKHTFLKSKYNKKDNILLTDLYSIFINPNIYIHQATRSLTTAILDSIVTIATQQAKRDVRDEIFVKIEGRIEDFCFGIPLDIFSTWGNFHEFFINSRFIIIIKEDEDLTEFKRLLNIFKRRMNLTDDQIEIYDTEPVNNRFNLVESIK